MSNYSHKVLLTLDLDLLPDLDLAVPESDPEPDLDLDLLADLELDLDSSLNNKYMNILLFINTYTMHHYIIISYIYFSILLFH